MFNHGSGRHYELLEGESKETFIMEGLLKGRM